MFIPPFWSFLASRVSARGARGISRVSVRGISIMRALVNAKNGAWGSATVSVQLRTNCRAYKLKG